MNKTLVILFPVCSSFSLKYHFDCICFSHIVDWDLLVSQCMFEVDCTFKLHDNYNACHMLANGHRF